MTTPLLLPVLPDLDDLLVDDDYEPADAGPDGHGTDDLADDGPAGEPRAAGRISPVVAGFVSRAQLGLRPPRSISRRITPGDGGVALHYGGPPVRINGHDDCLRAWKGWQDFHMGTRGWADIAYTGGFCQHGYALAGRGYGVRTAAQGTNSGNQMYLAACWLGGDGQTPTPAALNAAAWWTLTLRQAGAGNRTKPHRDFHSTSCPGPVLVGTARQLDGEPIVERSPWNPGVTGHPHDTPEVRLKPKPGQKNDPASVKDLQGHLNAWRRNRQRSLHLPTDGNFDEWTHIALQGFQDAYGLADDGICGPKTWKKVHEVTRGTALHS